MGCKRKTIQILKRVGKELTPILVKTAVNMVGVVEEMAAEDPAFFSSDVKRKVCGAGILAEARKGGMALAPRTVNLLVEFAVEAVKGPDYEGDLGDDDTLVPLTETI